MGNHPLWQCQMLIGTNLFIKPNLLTIGPPFFIFYWLYFLEVLFLRPDQISRGPPKPATISRAAFSNMDNTCIVMPILMDLSPILSIPPFAQGGAAALAAALLWSVASFLFARLGPHIQALEINFLKGILGLILLSIAGLFIGGLSSPIPTQALLILVISGIIGITLGDSAFLQALKHLGARRTLLMATLAPPMTGILAWIFLGETLTWLSWLGIALTAGGVAWVITERTPQSAANANRLWPGLPLGAFAALAQSSAVVLSRTVLIQTQVSALQTAIIRLLAGTLLIALWLLVIRQPLFSRIKFRSQKSLLRDLLLATFLGTFLAMWLQQISIELIPAGIAQTLISTSPLFILPIALLSGERVTPRAVLGVLVALAGVWLLFI